LNSQSTQKDTKEARKEARKPSRKQAHTLHHAGNSERTIRRRRKTLKDLQAKGFQTLPDFFRNKAEEKKKNAEYDTMVAKVKAQLRAFQGRDEDEEDSEAETEVVGAQGTSESSEPDVSEVMAEPDLDASQSPNRTSPVCTTLRESENCSESSQLMFEESEEESLDGADETGEPCGGLEDAQRTGQKMLEDLRHGNIPNSGSPQQSMDGVLDLLRDRVTLRTAHEELANITKENKLGDFDLSHIQAMVSFLNLFLDEDLEYTWKNASMIIAKAQGRGKTRARAIQEWVLCFICTGELPHHQMCWKCATVLADEEIAKAIRLALAEKGKSG
jgi:hypothetical protein